MSLSVKPGGPLAEAVYCACDLGIYTVVTVKQRWRYFGYWFCMGEFLPKAKESYQGELLRKERFLHLAILDFMSVKQK